MVFDSPVSPPMLSFELDDGSCQPIDFLESESSTVVYLFVMHQDLSVEQVHCVVPVRLTDTIS